MLFDANSTLLMIGDSITDCGRARPVGEGDGLGSGYVSFINALLTAEYPGANIKVLNTGIGGDTIRHLKARWKSDMLAFAPDYLSIKIGVNDVWRYISGNLTEHVPLDEYESVYRELIAATKPTVKKIILISPFLSERDRSDPMMAMLLDYIAVVKRIAVDESLLFVDTQAEFDRYIASGISPEALAGDRVHPSTTGAMVIARAFLKVCGAKV